MACAKPLPPVESNVGPHQLLAPLSPRTSSSDPRSISSHLGEAVVAPGFPGPPPHFHERLHDTLYVLDGTLTCASAARRPNSQRAASSAYLPASSTPQAIRARPGARPQLQHARRLGELLRDLRAALAKGTPQPGGDRTDRRALRLRRRVSVRSPGACACRARPLGGPRRAGAIALPTITQRRSETVTPAS
jgi:hypothetical protein